MDVSEVEDLLQFQSTLPVRGATAGPEGVSRAPGISIHAPRKGSDASTSSGTPRTAYFNPRSP